MARGSVERHKRTGRKGHTHRVAAAMQALALTRQAILSESDHDVQAELTSLAAQQGAEVAGLAIRMHTRGHSMRARLEQMAATQTPETPMDSMALLARQVGNKAMIQANIEVA